MLQPGATAAASGLRFALLPSLGLLGVGAAGYLSLPRGFWGFYVLSHLGALGVIGLFGCAAGFLALRRKRAFWTAFGLTSLAPIAAGAIAVLAFWVKRGHLYCGGAVTLPVGLLLVVAHALAPSTTHRPGDGGPADCDGAGTALPSADHMARVATMLQKGTLKQVLGPWPLVRRSGSSLVDQRPETGYERRICVTSMRL